MSNILRLYNLVVDWFFFGSLLGFYFRDMKSIFYNRFEQLDFHIYITIHQVKVFYKINIFNDNVLYIIAIAPVFKLGPDYCYYHYVES